MNEKLEDFFIEQGFKKLMEFVPGFAVYFIMENRYANAVCLIEQTIRKLPQSNMSRSQRRSAGVL